MIKRVFKSPMDRVRNPQGRPDWLAAKLLERLVSQTQDTRVKAVYPVVRNEIEVLLLKTLGPRTKQGRRVKELIQRGERLLQEIQAA